MSIYAVWVRLPLLEPRPSPLSRASRLSLGGIEGAHLGECIARLRIGLYRGRQDQSRKAKPSSIPRTPGVSDDYKARVLATERHGRGGLPRAFEECAGPTPRRYAGSHRDSKGARLDFVDRPLSRFSELITISGNAGLKSRYQVADKGFNNCC